jgi:hypothetical protein
MTNQIPELPELPEFPAELAETDPAFWDKIKMSLHSRKFWLTVILIASAGTMYYFENITSNVFIVVVTVAIGIYTGTLGFEDGMKKLMPLLPPLLDEFNSDQDAQKK